jgi:hypothetical protein
LARRLWWRSPVLWFALCLASLIPFLVVGMPPLTDLPNHIARYYILLNIAHSPFLSEYFSVHWQLIGNLGGDLLVEAIGRFLGADSGAKVVMALIPPLTIAGIYAVSRAVNGQVAPSALMSTPLAYNWPLTSGFVNFNLSAAMALLVLALWIRLRGRSFLARLVIFSPLSFATWVAHVAGWGLLGLAVLGFELARSYQISRVNIRTLALAAFETFPFALTFLLTVVWRTESEEPIGVAFGSDILYKKFVSIVTLFREHYQSWDVACSVLFLVLTIWMFVAGGRKIMTAAAAVAVCYGLAFVAFPEGLFAGTNVDRRLLPYAAMFVPLSIGVADGVLENERRRRLLSVVAIAAVVFFGARVTVTAIAWNQLDRSLESHLKLLEGIPRHSRVFALALEECEKPWSRSRLDHLQQLAIPRTESLINGLFTGLNEVQYREKSTGGFDWNMFAAVDTESCQVPYVRESLQSAIRQFPRDRFQFLWLIAPTPLPRFDESGLELIGSNGNDRLYAVIPR